MFCPSCNHGNTRVSDSRMVADENKIRRRRVCEKCNNRFTTFEIIEELFPMLVKSDNTRESYNANKVLAGIHRAVEKRPVSAEQTESILKYIETQLRNTHEKEISAKQIGEWVMKKLVDIDQVAYVRFASVYRSFQDVSAFQQEIDRLQKSFKDKM